MRENIDYQEAQNAIEFFEKDIQETEITVAALKVQVKRAEDHIAQRKATLAKLKDAVQFNKDIDNIWERMLTVIKS